MLYEMSCISYGIIRCSVVYVQYVAYNRHIILVRKLAYLGVMEYSAVNKSAVDFA